MRVVSGESARAEAVERQRAGGLVDLPGRQRAASAPVVATAQPTLPAPANHAGYADPEGRPGGNTGPPRGGGRVEAEPNENGTPDRARASADPHGPVQDGGVVTESGFDTDAGTDIEPTTGVVAASLHLPGPPPAGAAVPAIVPPQARPAAQPQPGPAPTPAAPDDDPPFWLPVEDVMRDSPAGAQTHSVPAGEVRRPPARPPEVAPRRLAKPSRRPATGLASLLLLSLLASFFAWVSAEPLWLALGHGDAGTATVTGCTGGGVTQRCRGEFTAATGTFTAADVPLAGIDTTGRRAGTRVTAVMVGAHGRAAYVAGGWAAPHLRWALGLLGLLLCGAGIVWGTGALRLEDARSRRSAALAGLAAPLLVTIGFLAATY